MQWLYIYYVMLPPENSDSRLWGLLRLKTQNPLDETAFLATR